MARRVRWGIISTARIGTQKVIPAMQRAPHCEVLAIASRSQASAVEAAAALGIPKAYGSVEALLADTEIDAVYNPLPNHLHVPVSIQALEAGKHVLCEKPIALSSTEAQRLADVAAAHPELRCMEAFMYRHHPQWRRARQMVRDGTIGRLVTVHAFFSYFNDDPDNIRHFPEMGGGALMDIGCYPISLSRFLFEREPERVSSVISVHPDYGVDTLSSAMMDFGNGTATFTCGTQLAAHQRVQIYGEQGRIEIEIPFNAPPDRPCRLWLQRADSSPEEIWVEICDQYTVQGELFSLAVLEQTEVPTPLSDAVANMKVIEAIRRASSTQSWEQV